MKQWTRWILPLLLICGTGALYAQSTNSGDIRGTVTDTSGAVVPDTTVTVRNVSTGVSGTYTTNSAGVFDTSSIVAGSYEVTFTRQGFDTLVRGPITVEVGFTTLNAELKVGAVSQKVVVTTNVPLLQTESGAQTATLNAKSMAQLPQTGAPTWENFVILLPGATGCTGNDCSQGTNNPGQVASINGNLPYNNILADGASTTLSHSQNANPAIFETVDELQVSTSSFSAQYGIGGIIFNQISKGGTNHFHGSGYDYLQNDKMNANNYGFVSQPTVPYERYNDFGFSVGGPIKKDKIFFFFDYDQIVDHGSANNNTNDIPTVAVMGGDFTGELPIYDPTTQTIAYDSGGNPYPVRQSFQQEYGSNAIPAAMIDAVSQKFEQWYPTPSNHIAGGKFVNGSIGADGQEKQNFYSSLPQSTPYRKYFGRLDYQITSNNRLSMSDTQSDTPVQYPSSFTACPIGCQSGDVDNNNAQVTDVWNISPTTINEARMGYTWQGNFFADLSLGKGYPSQLGWQFAKADTIPSVQFTRNYPYAWIGPSSNAVYKEHVYDPSDVVTMIRGRHILHFGGELLAYQDNSTAWGNTNAGTMQFSGAYTEQWSVDPKTGVASPNTSTGLEYADFLLGLSNNWSAAVSPEYGARLKSPQVFVQDDWKLSPTLTVNLGLRYQMTHGWSETHGNEAIWDPTITNSATGSGGAYWYGTTHANGRDSLFANTYNTWLPRVGFSWLARPNTTLRGGVGLYAYNWSLDNYGSGMGSETSNSGNDADQTNGITPVVKFGGNGDVYGTGNALPYVAASTSPTAYNGQGANFNLYHTPVPKIWQWNLEMQRELSTNMVANLSYVGSHGYNLRYNTDLNAIPVDHIGPNDSPTYRPYPEFQGISGSSDNGISNYNSLQVSVNKRLSSGLSFTANYVWSHFLDDQDSSGWGSRSGPTDYQIANNPSANYSNSNFDVRNALKGYVVYDLPFGKGRAYLNSNVLVDEALGGWQVSGTTLLTSGQPFSVFSTQANYQQAGSMMPDWNPGVSWKPKHRATRCEAGSAATIVTTTGTYNTGCINEWYDPAAFLEPAAGAFGNVRRNSLYGPGVAQFNMSAGKTFRVWEGVSFQFRADATNVFNHASFSQPTGTLQGATGAGQPYTWLQTIQTSSGPLQVPTNQINGTSVGGRTMQLEGRVTF
ncbi:MAG TPA: TonB-dependent receptor [Acidobacteriaceae bacterium]|nr:TonB-dependent receptor [Acidobacteriaceae bacterium]